MNVIFAGHYATETTGIKALQKIIEEKFDVETFFINVPTNL
jgi:putative NIF3 family GTP cyclohydrolase 1 type 2